MISGDELVCCLDGCFSALFAAGQLISCHAGRGIQKSHIVMIHFDFLVYTIQKALYLNFPGFFQPFILRIFISQPDLSSPEPTGPVIVRNRLIETVLAVCFLELLCKFRQIPDYLLRGKLQSVFDLRICDLRIFLFVKCYHSLILYLTIQPHPAHSQNRLSEALRNSMPAWF